MHGTGRGRRWPVRPVVRSAMPSVGFWMRPKHMCGWSRVTVLPFPAWQWRGCKHLPLRSSTYTPRNTGTKKETSTVAVGPCMWCSSVDDSHASEAAPSGLIRWWQALRCRRVGVTCRYARAHVLRLHQSASTRSALCSCSGNGLGVCLYSCRLQPPATTHLVRTQHAHAVPWRVPQPPCYTRTL